MSRGSGPVSSLLPEGKLGRKHHNTLVTRPSFQRVDWEESIMRHHNTLVTRPSFQRVDWEESTMRHHNTLVTRPSFQRVDWEESTMRHHNTLVTRFVMTCNTYMVLVQKRIQ